MSMLEALFWANVALIVASMCGVEFTYRMAIRYTVGPLWAWRGAMRLMSAFGAIGCAAGAMALWIELRPLLARL